MHKTIISISFLFVCLFVVLASAATQSEVSAENLAESLPENLPENLQASPPEAPAEGPVVEPNPAPSPTPNPSPAPSVAAAPEKVSTEKKLKWSGDLRYRATKSHEAIDQNRYTQQLRARLGVTAEVNKDVDAVVRLMTGTKAVSGNQTLGDSSDPGMPRRSFGIDWAYIDWHLGESSHLWVGRTANPFWAPGKTGIIFDPNLAFEGVALKLEKRGPGGGMFLNLDASVISENYKAPDDVVDTGLVGGDAGLALKTDFGTFTGHAGFYHYLNVTNRLITTVEKGATIDPYSYPSEPYKGNSVYRPDPAKAEYFFAYQYAIWEAGAEWKWQVKPFDFLAYYDAALNDRVRAAHRAEEYGISAKYKRVQLVFVQLLREADSVFAAYTDADTNGGGTDNRGKRISFIYHLADNSQLAYHRYRADRGISTVERPYEADRLELQVSF